MDVVELDSNLVLSGDAAYLADVRRTLDNGHLLAWRSAVPEAQIEAWIDYLSHIGRSSLPNYTPITANAPNFHRITRWDDRSSVAGCFHQFSFFPWNDDIFDLFSATTPIFSAKHVITDYFKQSADSSDSELTEWSDRLSFQFYPSGVGGLSLHSDPSHPGQAVVPILTMSTKGQDFNSGGLYVVSQGDRVFLDDLSSPGDVLFFDPSMPHGVDGIDPGAESNWTGFRGRWMLLFATNSLEPNSAVGRATRLSD